MSLKVQFGVFKRGQRQNFSVDYVQPVCEQKRAVLWGMSVCLLFKGSLEVGERMGGGMGAEVPGVLCLVGRVVRSPSLWPPIAPGVPHSRCGSSCGCLLLISCCCCSPGCVREEDSSPWGGLVAVIWYDKGEFRTAAAAGGGEGSDFAVSVWEGIGFSGGSAPSRAQAVAPCVFSSFKFPSCMLQYLAKALLSPVEAHPVLHPQGCILSLPRLASGFEWWRTPCPALPSSLCKPEPAFPSGTSSLGERNVGMSRCSNCCASSCLRMLHLE